MIRSRRWAALLLATALSPVASAGEDLSAELEKRLKDRKGVPGMVALRIEGGKVVAMGAAGIRKWGEKSKVTTGDKFHLGSCTKAMTATLAAVLVERGKIKWDTTVGEVLKEDWVHEAYRSVTLTQLLSHTGGCPASPPNALWMELFMSAPKTKPMVQRMKLAKGVLSKEPSYQPGEGTEYSNTGYAIAGIMLERVGGDPWEELMEKEIFGPLGMKSAGFRAPASGRRKIDQPWGHKGGKPIPPKPYGDNPDAIGPAGTVHCSIEDWAKFALFHLDAKPGGILKKIETFAVLHRPPGEKSNHALGWLIDGKALAHDGSNTMWYAVVKLVPEDKSGVLVCVNAGDGDAPKLCHEVLRWLDQ